MRDIQDDIVSSADAHVEDKARALYHASRAVSAHRSLRGTFEGTFQAVLQDDVDAYQKREHEMMKAAGRLVRHAVCLGDEIDVSPFEHELDEPLTPVEWFEVFDDFVQHVGQKESVSKKELEKFLKAMIVQAREVARLAFPEKPREALKAYAIDD